MCELYGEPPTPRSARCSSASLRRWAQPGGAIPGLGWVEGAAVTPKVRWQGKALALGRLPAGAIRSWRLGSGKPRPVDLLVG